MTDLSTLAEVEMEFTNAHAWLNAHELVDCKPYKGRWTRRTCHEIYMRAQRSSGYTGARYVGPHIKNVPCSSCPVMAAILSQ